MIDLAQLRLAARQDQFLDVVAPEIAHARFQAHLALEPLGAVSVALLQALGRVLAYDIAAPVDTPGFDRASVDGFAVCAADLVGASETAPVWLAINQEILTPGVRPTLSLAPGTATPIATGGMLPRGADAVVMVEHTESGPVDETLRVAFSRPATSGSFVAMAGSDIARGETLLRAGCRIGAGEIGMLAAVGLAEVSVWRRPRVAIFSTGDEIVAPGQPIRPGQVFDSNAAILAASVVELGGEPVLLGIVPDDAQALRAMLTRALVEGDVVLLSGGTSKGAGDIAAKVVSELRDPGVVVHGVAIKPGKPLCLAVSNGKPVAVLPGFPTSAIMSFHEFIAPVIRAFAGVPQQSLAHLEATLAIRVASERGRMEHVLVSLVQDGEGGLVAYPTGKGSGAVTSFTQADGFFAVPALVESISAGTLVPVQRIGAARPPAELVIIGSHCVGLDYIVGQLERQGVAVKLLNVGSHGGLAAARRGECDIAPIHLMDPQSGVYNRPFLPKGVELVQGYGRMQGLVFRLGDPRFAGSVADAMASVLSDPACVMMNRNAGSGTRVLIDQLLQEAKPAGFTAQAKSHNGVAVAVAQGRADWGVAIATVAARYGLGFLPLQAERYDFAIPKTRLQSRAVQRFIAVLVEPETQWALDRMGFIATRQKT